MKEEVWKDIKGYEGLYQASNLGRIRSLDRFVKGRIEGFKALKKGKILKPAVSNRGYLRSVVCNETSKRNIGVHRLVALAFIPNFDITKAQINHIDGIKANNIPENLEWCDQTHNNRHARKTGLNVARYGIESHSYGLKNKQSHILIHSETGELKPICEVAKEYGYTTRHITMMVKGERTNKTKYSLLII